MIPATSQRVVEHTTESVNRRIHRDMQQRVDAYSSASSDQVEQRLLELDHEWDTERVLEANASALTFAGCILASTVNRRWIALPLAVSAFLFQHAVQGWCPPLPIIRRLGVRTMREIDQEREALQALLHRAD